jgi:pilus assembly protein Flp/PilA
MVLPFTTKTEVNNWVSLKREPLMRKFLADFLTSESGATAIEYGLIAAGIAVAIIAAVQSVGTALNADLSASAKAINP